MGFSLERESLNWFQRKDTSSIAVKLSLPCDAGNGDRTSNRCRENNLAVGFLLGLPKLWLAIVLPIFTLS
jgi:hypothetical protein